MSFISPELISKLRSFLEQRHPQFLENLREMVGINSFTLNRDGVNALGRRTADLLRPLGFAARRVPAADPRCGDHLVLGAGGDDLPRLGLVSHLDTVFPAHEEQENDFAWRVEGQRIYGPGTIDIKGGTVMILMVLAAIRHTLPHVFARVGWRVLLNGAEEHLVPDFGALCRQELGDRTRAALVFEAGKWHDSTFSLVTARKGRVPFWVEARGRGAHAGTQHGRGASAINQLAQVIPRIEALTDHTRERTCNVGTIRGGEAVNRVPHHAVLEGELRAFDPAVLAEGIDAIRELDSASSVRSVHDGFPAALDVRVGRLQPPWPRNDGSAALFDCWRRAALLIGVGVEEEARGGLSDGNLLWDSLPTLDGLGPVGDNAHCSERSPDGSKEQEFIDVESLVPKALLNCLGVLLLIDKYRE